MRTLMNKVAVSLANDGIIDTAKRSVQYIKDRNRKKEKIHSFVDVLFINGCALPHPMRYRVVHQAEQLLMANITSNTIFYEDLDPVLVNYARVFVFYRCPYTDTIGDFIQKAKNYNKTVIYDIDDLVFDTYYTNQVKYVANMSEHDKAVYDSGVDRMGKTLNLCDIATTTTEALAEELSKYVKNVYVNRNVASDSMIMYSEDAMIRLEQQNEATNDVKKNNNNEKEDTQIKMGYFSGSITHNDDFNIILPAVCRIMNEFENVHLYMVGELDLPESLKVYAHRIHALPFMNWTKLPYEIAKMDMNLAPLEDTLFNRAKSENKWTEASLVKVVTIASNVGAFNKMMQDNVTGILCENNEDDWYEKIKHLITDNALRKKVAINAYNYVKENCITMETSFQYGSLIRKLMNSNVVFKIPMAQITGGILVAQKHASVLQNHGYDVTFIHDGAEKIEEFTYNDNAFPLIRSRSAAILGSIDIAVATLYTTMEFVQNYPNIKKRMYLVQGLETLFPKPGEWARVRASQAYMPIGNVQFITVSNWCESWLKKKYGITPHMTPNGIDCELFYPMERSFDGKIRILIEGNSNDDNKNVDESFRITNKLDKDKYEIWYISYDGKGKEWYDIDQSFTKIPNRQMPDIYRKCHILLKSSIMESFSYPPLEMMATGGFCVVRENEGNKGYLKHMYNCMFYKPEDLDTAVEAIGSISQNVELRKLLFQNGIGTAQEREWGKLEERILDTYC